MESFKIRVDNRDFVVICLRGRSKALLDRTVAEIYEVTTKAVNRAVKRNPEKFPEDFCFELTPDEAERMYTLENYDLKGEVVPNLLREMEELSLEELEKLYLSLKSLREKKQKILSFAGSWEDMKNFEEFMENITTRRKGAFQGRESR